MSMTRRIPHIRLEQFRVYPSTAKETLDRFNAKLGDVDDTTMLTKYITASNKFISSVKKKGDFNQAFYVFKAACIKLGLYANKHGRMASTTSKISSVTNITSPKTQSFEEFTHAPDPNWRSSVDKDDKEVHEHLEMLEREEFAKSQARPVDKDSIDYLLNRAKTRIEREENRENKLSSRLKSKIEGCILEIEIIQEKLDGLLKLDDLTKHDPTIFKLLIDLKDDIDSIQH